TPHWIVRYLVENSLGRLWLLNRPDSKLVEQMDYYIKPEQPETDFLHINKPEDIKICDPACGSGHMLTYAFDLLYAIYEEEGYEHAEIPSMILTHNLYGIEIDERAGELAAFALTMKARAKQRRFFTKDIKPNICVLENIQFDEGEIEEYMDFVGRDLFTAPLQTTLRQFEETDNFGSLIRPEVTDVENMLRILESKNVSGHLFLSLTHQKVLQALRQADYLSPKYHVVIANPPYMGVGSMNPQLVHWVKKRYQLSKADLYTMFVERALDGILTYGYAAFITIQNWMFLTSFERFRVSVLDRFNIRSMIQIGFNSFPELNSKVVQAAAFIIHKANSDAVGEYINLNDVAQSADKNQVLLNKIAMADIYRKAKSQFLSLPGAPIAYWLSRKFLSLFNNEKFSDVAYAKMGMRTGNNERFLRQWFEISKERLGLGYGDADSALASGKKWFPYQKGGENRRWYGVQDFVVNWEGNGREIKALTRDKYPELGDNLSWKITNEEFYFRRGGGWTALTSGRFSVRYYPNGFIIDTKGQCFYEWKNTPIETIIGTANSIVTTKLVLVACPSLDFNSGPVGSTPFLKLPFDKATIITKNSKQLIELHTEDWNSFETAWDFSKMPLLNYASIQPSLMKAYEILRSRMREVTKITQRLEEENNRIFIEAYDLQDELTPEVPLKEITLTCNPHYRYGSDKSEEELEALLLADTMRELVSYAVGCMFGRYALDKPGLILANQGETIEDYLKQVPKSSFPADDDNAIPMLDGDWFTDDIAERFRKFLRLAFGEEHYEENLAFIEAALGKNGKARDIRDYFLKDFYSDHVKRYKKRPIYWLFSSPKGSFNTLIYMHRYRPDTVSVVLNDYLREFRTKLTVHKNHLEAVSISASSSPAEKTKALKEIEKVAKMITEMEEYEREVLYPLATEQVEIDLDDGVKINYPKFGAALKKIPGLDAKNEE
ncbi:MAG: BREX-1 system adenine-specific DNA-methyltransferase PglX, partial [Nitrosomonas sp.]|nr:BREX-1 system adenine-specific DNA-methyltransferase PglX [Nitrosomonas sp.]